MLLTRERFGRIASDARADLRNALCLIATHEELLNSRRAAHFLIPPIVLTAAAAWERFATDLVGAAMKADWTGPGDWDRPAAWPGTGKDADGVLRLDPAVLERQLDERLLKSGVLDEPLTSHWQAWTPTSWYGRRPVEWFLLDYASPVRAHAETLQSLMRGAKTARDAVGHEIQAKKAAHAGEDYWWHSDNDGRPLADGGFGRPTLQGGYARGVVALFVQLVDCSIAAVSSRNGWGDRHRLPADWFRARPRQGTILRDVPLWGGEALHRVP